MSPRVIDVRMVFTGSVGRMIWVRHSRAGSSHGTTPTLEWDVF